MLNGLMNNILLSDYIFILDLSGLSFLVPRKCEPPDPPLDYFIPDPEPEATLPPHQRLDYIEETCIKLKYICSSSLRKRKMRMHMTWIKFSYN